MKFEQPPQPESQKKLPIEQMEAGEISEWERGFLEEILAYQERYGMPLEFRNEDFLNKRRLDVWSNLFGVREGIDGQLGLISGIASKVAFNELPKSKKEIYLKLKYEDPERLSEEGLTGLSVEDIFKEPDITKMSEKELEKVLLQIDYEEARVMAKYGKYHPLTGKALPNEKKDPGGFGAAVLDLMDYFTQNRHSYQEGAKLLLKYKIFVDDRGRNGIEHLQEIKKRIGK